MSRNVVLISYTQLGAPGGVPRFNRDLIHALPNGKHYSWLDMLKALGRPDTSIWEWDKARALNGWLKATGKVKRDDIILVDGFWGLGLEDLPNVVSVAHGNWSHTTKEDVDRGVPPEFPLHAAVQLEYRKKMVEHGGRIVAVSDFIARECKIQWGFEFPVINNGIDLTRFSPTTDRKPRKRPVIIHGTTTANKGLDHVELIKQKIDVDVLLLDDAAAFFGLPKYPALAQADLVVHPSAHEGNSYFVLETLASGIPIVSYDVGLMYRAARGPNPLIGSVIMPRTLRNKEMTLDGVKKIITHDLGHDGQMARYFAEGFSVEIFRREWLEYLGREFGYDPME